MMQMSMWPWGFHHFPFLSPCCPLSWFSQLLPVGTAQGRGRSCCSLATEAGSVLVWSQPLSYPPRCHPHRGSSSLQQSHPWGQGCLPGSAKPHKAASARGRSHRSLRGLTGLGWALSKVFFYSVVSLNLWHLSCYNLCCNHWCCPGIMRAKGEFNMMLFYVHGQM